MQLSMMTLLAAPLLRRALPLSLPSLLSLPVPCPLLSVTQSRAFAGHSKWSKIKRSKGATDALNAAASARVCKAITTHSRSCGGDLSNMRLRSALSQARAIKVPKDTIDAAVKRGLQKVGGENPEDVVYDGTISANFGVISVRVKTSTDKKSRTAPAIRHAFSKFGGELGKTGSLDYLFTERGILTVRGVLPDKVDLLADAAISAGALDIDFAKGEEGDKGEGATVVCEVKDLSGVVEAVTKIGLDVDFDLRQICEETSMMDMEEADDETLTRFDKFLDFLNENDDVVHVFHNAK